MRLKGKVHHDKRKYPRLEIKLKVSFRTMDEFLQGYTRNISSGGIFLKTNQLLDPNAEIDLVMNFPNGLGDHRVRGKVTRLMSLSHPSDSTKQVYGAGIRFLNPSPELIQIIENAFLNKS